MHLAVQRGGPSGATLRWVWFSRLPAWRRSRVRGSDGEPGGEQPWSWVERTELGVRGAEAGRVGAGAGGGGTRCARALQRTPPARAAACCLRWLGAAITAVSAAVQGWKFPALLQASRGAGPHLTTWAASHAHVTFWLPPPPASGPAPGRPLSLPAQCCASLFHVWPAGAQPHSETWLFCALSPIAAFISQSGCESQAVLGPSVCTAWGLGASRLPCELRPA